MNIVQHCIFPDNIKYTAGDQGCCKRSAPERQGSTLRGSGRAVTLSVAIHAVQVHEDAR